MMRNLLLLLAFAVLSGCSLKWVSPDLYALRGLGEPICPQTPNADSAARRSDCAAQIKRYNEEYDTLQKEKSLSLKGVLNDQDPICYKNPQAGEKPCLTTEPKEK